MDLIHLKRMRFQTCIGVLPEEKIKPQSLVISVSFSTDVKKAAKRDCIEDADDYSAVRVFIGQFVSVHHFLLLETMAERLSEALLSHFSWGWLRLSVDKPDIFSDVDSVGVEIERPLDPLPHL